jgi:hypothetical protein
MKIYEEPFRFVYYTNGYYKDNVVDLREFV